MTLQLAPSVFGILSWMKEQLPVKYLSLDAAAARFGLDRDQMRRNMQWLQRHECVKRGGRANAEWSITELGLVRLAEARFSPAGAFLSPYDQTRKSSESNPDQERHPAEGTPAEATEGSMLDLWNASTVPVWARPAGQRAESTPDTEVDP